MVLYGGSSPIYLFFSTVGSLFIYCGPGDLWSPSRFHPRSPVLPFYMLPPGCVFRKHGFSCRCFADDIQIYLLLKSKGKDSVQPLLDRLSNIKSWMRPKFLNLNKSKTEMILFGLHVSLSSSVEIQGPLSSTICF